MSNVINNDAVIINTTLFCKAEQLEEIRKKAIQQIREDGVAILPTGFTAVFARRECLFCGTDMRGGHNECE